MITGSLSSLFDELDAIAEPGQYVSGAVVEIRAELQKTASAGQAPDGTTWKPRESDGGKPLRNAMANIDVRQVSPTQAVIELKGHHVFHHYGAGDNPVRKIIPTEIDEKLGNAIARGVVKPYKERAT
jgi:hypothetical protein